MENTVVNGDCLEVLKSMPDASVDSVVTDPPYGLSFMGKKWDYDVPGKDVWAECLRVLKPGGHLLSFAGTRTQHRMAVNIEDAGFEIRDMIAWVYGAGFPKSLDVSKAIDKAAGAEREVVGQRKKLQSYGADVNNVYGGGPDKEGFQNITAPATEAARQWQGWGTSLKPAWENIGFYRKPLTVAGYCANMISNITERIESCRRNAVNAEPSSIPSQAESLEGRTNIVQENVATRIEEAPENGTVTGAADGINSKADTLGSIPVAGNTALSTLLSWRDTLAGVYDAAKTSTTSTAFEKIIDWKILNFCLLQITPDIITKARFSPSGLSADALRAVEYSIASLASLQSILTLSALAPAMSQEASDCLDVGASPSLEPITVARKPLIGTVAANVLAHGTGGINVDGCRVEGEKPLRETTIGKEGMFGLGSRLAVGTTSQGRWPANLIHDGSDEVVGLFPESKSTGGSGKISTDSPVNTGGGNNYFNFGDTGSAARFFKCCKKDCPDCLTCAKACDSIVSNHEERIALWKNIFVLNAEKSGWTSQATSEFIARASAIGLANEKLVPNVRSAGSLCDLCATSIAVALVGTKTSAFSSEELQAILAYTVSCNVSILTQSLASFAELWASTDIIPTTGSLSILFGSVRDAIANSTQQGSAGEAGRASAPSRFAYIPKASKKDRDGGCEGLEVKSSGECVDREEGSAGMDCPRAGAGRTSGSRNHHPTVKPTALMRYLVRLVTPPGGLVLDPFAGSGSTCKAAKMEGFRFIGIEREAEYVTIANARIAAVQPTLGV